MEMIAASSVQTYMENNRARSMGAVQAAQGVAGLVGAGIVGSGTGANASKKLTVTSNKGRVIDITPSANHRVTQSTAIRGAPNSSVDIVNAKGELVTRRWFGPDGRQIRDVHFTNHGNPKKHPEWPHEQGPY